MERTSALSGLEGIGPVARFISNALMRARVTRPRPQHFGGEP